MSRLGLAAYLGMLNDASQSLHDDPILRRQSLDPISQSPQGCEPLTSQVFLSRKTILLFNPASTANSVEKLFSVKHFCQPRQSDPTPAWCTHIRQLDVKFQ